MKYFKIFLTIFVVFLLQGCTTNSYYHEARNRNGELMYDDYGRKLYYYSDFVIVQTRRGELEIDKDSGEVTSRFQPRYYRRLEQ